MFIRKKVSEKLQKQEVPREDTAQAAELCGFKWFQRKENNSGLGPRVTCLLLLHG